MTRRALRFLVVDWFFNVISDPAFVVADLKDDVALAAVFKKNGLVVRVPFVKGVVDSNVDSGRHFEAMRISNWSVL